MSFVIEKNSSMPFVQAPAGRYQAVCVDVVDEGMQPNTFKEGKLEPKISIAFQLNKLNDDGRRYLISRWFTFSLHEKASLSAFVCDFLEIPYAQLPDTFDVETLIGRNVRMKIMQEPKKSNPQEMRAIIKTIEPWLPEDGALMASLDYKRKIDREDYQSLTDDEVSDMTGNKAVAQSPQPQPQPAQAPATRKPVPKAPAETDGDPRMSNGGPTARQQARAILDGAEEIDDKSVFDDDVTDEERAELMQPQPSLLNAPDAPQAAYPAN